jgi:glutamine amidotransferase-like uncharacterized protein
MYIISKIVYEKHLKALYFFCMGKIMKIDKKVVFILAFILVLILFVYISPEIKIVLEHKEGYPIDPTSKNPVALVYRGSAGCSGCSEAIGALLKNDPTYNFSVIYVGPDEELSIQEGLKLKNVVLYAQPGGDGTVNQAFKTLRSDKAAIQNFVKNGGRYVGFCMGGYFVDDDPGFGLGLNTNQYIKSKGATVTTERDSIIQVSWRGNTRWMYFQDGPYFIPDRNVEGQIILATYTNGEVAAIVQPYGKGKIGVSGPHPEADASWYVAAGLVDPDGLDEDLFRDLIDTLMK